MPKPVVTLVQYSGMRDGAALSALAIGEGFRKRGCEIQLVFGTTGEAFELSKQHGYNTHLWEHKNWLRDQRIIGFLKNYYQESSRSKPLLKLLQSNRTDLVYVNTMASLGAAIAASRNHSPCIWHIREQFQEDGGELRAPKLIKTLLPRLWKHFTNAFVFNTHAAKHSMYGNRIGGQVIPVGISDSFGEKRVPADQCRSILKLPQKATLIGIPGGLRKVKGHDWFLSATSNWLVSNPSIHVAFAGVGSETITNELRQLVANFNLNGRIHFLGSVEKMQTFYQSCNLICIPSRGESFGRCAVEAMASRVPVVASAVGGLKEIIQHGENGMLVSFADDQGLVNALNHVLNNLEVTAKMVNQAHQDFTRLYTESVYQDSICDYAFNVWQQSKS